MSFAEFSFEIQ